MQPDVRDKILARPRAREIMADPPREPTYEEIVARFGGPGVSEEEMLLRLEASDDEIAAMRVAPPVRGYEPLDATSPLIKLVEQLTRRTDRGYIYVQKGDFSLTLARHHATIPTEAPVGA